MAVASKPETCANSCEMRTLNKGLKVPAANTTMILLANSDGASRGFGLGIGNVLQSPFARLFISWVMYEGNVSD